MKKHFFTLIALLLTGVFAFLGFRLFFRELPRPVSMSLLRVWVTGSDPSLNAWIRKGAAFFERQTGKRVYVRSASQAEAAGLASGTPETNTELPLPDLLLSPGTGDPVALFGYALVVRDDSAPVATPMPTGALFFRPSPSPGPTPLPPAAPDISALPVVYAPMEMSKLIPGAVPHPHPDSAMIQNNPSAALLTAEQAAGLSCGYRAYPMPDGRGFRAAGGKAFTPEGRELLAFLKNEKAQLALKAHGLYSPFLRLYQGQGTLHEQIESSLPYTSFTDAWAR